MIIPPKLTDIKGISEKRLEVLSRLHIKTIWDLVFHFPKEYEDLSHIITLDQAFLLPQKAFVCVEIIAVSLKYLKKTIPLTEIKIKDSVAQATLVMFGKQNYFGKIKPGEFYLVSGVFEYKNSRVQSTQFIIEDKLETDSSQKVTALHHSRIIPLYSLTEGISQRALRDFIFQALQILSPLLPENLPSFLVKENQFLSRKNAIEQIHFPHSFDSLEKARLRLKYSELFKLQFQFALKRFYFKTSKNRIYQKETSYLDHFISKLPFTLTKSQIEVLEEIKADLYSPRSMHRLLLGDVGSGKTLVAFISLLLVIQSGFQGVLLVPTEVLAHQHYTTFTNLTPMLSLHFEVLTGSTKLGKKNEILHSLSSGECDLLIGTHAIFSENIVYKNLGLVVIDEQHKFGVEQRKDLVEKGQNPDLLVMSATPIPRTLGFTLFGDMDVSTIKQKPVGRLEIQTSLFDDSSLESLYSLLKIELSKGHQGYIVYPLVEESEILDLKSVTQSYEILQKSIFKDYKLGLLHGKMKDEEKKQVIEKFKAGNIHILVATTVIEVGIDIPNATFMVIENAERFGLSSLHQLRGRVGRSHIQSYCYLTTPKIASLSPTALERLNIMIETSDGLLIAEKDLELRGAGNLLGTEQKGRKGLILASLIHDSQILEKARKDAFSIIEDDPLCEKEEHWLLKHYIKGFEEEYHTILHN